MKIKNPFSNKITSDKWNKLLIFLIIFHILFFSIFHLLNKNYQTWDSAGHIGLSYRIAQEMERFLSGVEGSSLKSILKTSNYYPPFVQIIGAVISLTFGYKSTFLLIESLVFFILSIIFTYKLVFLLTKDQKKSFLTAFIYSIFPQVIDQSHYFHLDIPLTALVLMALYFLFTSDSFRNTKRTIFFFIFFSFIQLTKWTGFIFLVVPVVITLFNSFAKKNTENNKKGSVLILRNLLIGSAIFLALTIPWYYVNWNELMAQVKVFSVGESDDPANLKESLIYYPKNAISYQIMFLPFVLSIISIIYSLKKNLKNSILLLISILVPWLFFVFVGNKNLRYTLPLTPLVAYLISDLLLSVPKKDDSKLGVASWVVVVYLLFSSSFLSFSGLKKENPILKPIGIVFTGPFYKTWYYGGTSFYAYKPYRYPVDEILDFIYSDADEKEQAIGVSILIDSENMSSATFELVRIENGYNNVYMPVPYFQFEPFKSDEEIKSFFTETNTSYVVTSSYIGPEGLRNYKTLEQVTGFLESNRNKMFEKIKEFTLPDGEKVSVYKRIGTFEQETSTEGCKIGAGIEDGIETIKLTPNHTYLFFTGHFAIQDKIWRDYERGVMYLVQIENTVHESYLDVHNLPKSGSSFCSINGLSLDVTSDIKRILTEKNQCGEGIDCNKVIHAKWSVGDPDVSITEYTRDMFNF
jgi:4-amino-4-deoxy-L-arabinose transferase-like glycosyltransferase